MSETINFARMYTAQLNEALSQLPEDGFEEINRVLQDARETGRQVFVVGNGGSAATASHMVCDFSKNTREAGRN